VRFVAGGLGHAVERPIPDEAENTDRRGAGALLAHLPAQRAPLPQRVEHQAGDEGAVLRPGIASGISPGFQREADRPVAGLDLGQNVNCRA